MSASSPQEEKKYIFKMSPLSITTRHTSQQQQQRARTETEETTTTATTATTTAAAIEPPFKRQKGSSGSTITLPLRPTVTESSPRPSINLPYHLVADDTNPSNYMSDGSRRPMTTMALASANREAENEARALRVVEIMNDFRTLQTHISSLVTRPEANPPDQASYYLPGYTLLRECKAAAQAILAATNYNGGNLGGAGGVPDTEVQKATLQRIILDASTRRFTAHRIYLRAGCGMRWVQLRQQLKSGSLSPGAKAQGLARIDARLAEELQAITDERIVNDLRTADTRNRYWLAEDPSLQRILAWSRR